MFKNSYNANSYWNKLVTYDLDLSSVGHLKLSSQHYLGNIIRKIKIAILCSPQCLVESSSIDYKTMYLRVLTSGRFLIRAG